METRRGVLSFVECSAAISLETYTLHTEPIRVIFKMYRGRWRQFVDLHVLYLLGRMYSNTTYLNFPTNVRILLENTSTELYLFFSFVRETQFICNL
jgi:hypothetical protein